MKAREHAYTGTVNDAGRGWVGYCKCGWRTPAYDWKDEAQAVLSQHIHSAVGVAPSDYDLPASSSVTGGRGGGASGAAGFSITTPLPPASPSSRARPSDLPVGKPAPPQPKEDR